jgi:hypothetical protein
MTQVKVLLAGLIAGVALGVLSHGTAAAAQVPSLANGKIVIAGDEAQPTTENISAEDPESSSEDSAKMGKEQGTHTGPNQGATPENDTQKADQPARRNPTTGGDADKE